MIPIEEIQKLALLSQLKFDSEKIKHLANELNNIIVMINSLKSVNCDNIKPLISVNDMKQRLATDEVTIDDISSEILANAPGETGNLAREIKCFIVPKVVE